MTGTFCERIIWSKNWKRFLKIVSPSLYHSNLPWCFELVRHTWPCCKSPRNRRPHQRDTQSSTFCYYHPRSPKIREFIDKLNHSSSHDIRFLTWRSRVSLESLYGTWETSVSDDKALITFDKANSPALMEIPSFSRLPSAWVRLTRSLPARSTKWNFAVTKSGVVGSEVAEEQNLTAIGYKRTSLFFPHSPMSFSFEASLSCNPLKEIVTVKMACDRELFEFNLFEPEQWKGD